MSAALFRCGHPRTAENSRTINGGRAIVCRFCERMKRIVRSAKRAQERINAGGYTRSERILSEAER